MSDITVGENCRRPATESGRQRSRWRPAALAAVAAGVLAAIHATPAAAGEFTINVCQADRFNFSTQAVEDFATRGMMWKRACNPEGPGLRGLITSNVVRPGRVALGARSDFTLRAPEGTHFSRYAWAGQARRRDCRYALMLYATRPDGPPTAMKNVRANSHCPRPGRAQAAGWRTETYDITGATKIVQRVVCKGASSQPYCSARGRNYIRTFKAQAVVFDPILPTVSILQDNPFTRGEWVRGVQSVGYEAFDNTGVRLARSFLSGVLRGQHSRPCDYSRRVPCENGAGAIRFDTSSLDEGSQPLVVQAEDTGGNPGASGPVTVRVDNTAPGAVPVSVASGDAWRNTDDFDLAWSNPDEGDRAPIAGVHYRLCRSEGRDCTTGARFEPNVGRLADLQVPDSGEWKLSLWREDAAGNQEPANASVPVTLRYDPEAPQLGFEPPSSSDPTLVTVQVTERVSGLASGEIELSREGSGLWQTLPTQEHGDRLMARIDDAALPPGPYLLRARARDHASNESSTDLRLDGQPMRVTLPLRGSVSIDAGVVDRRTEERTVRRGGKRRKIRRRVTVLRPRVTAAFGRRVRIGGRLVNGEDQPVAGAEVLVFSRTATGPEQPLGSVQTDARGRYSYVAHTNATRTLRFVYPGTAQTLPTQDEVTLLVRAASTIRAKPRRLRNGQTVHFAGRLRSLPAPAGGKLVELQVVLSGRWQTFRTLRTGSDGRWQARYRFRRSCGLVRYRFRLRLPAETGYPFEVGRTHAVTVRVRGAACR
jgi:hypothetical protein